MCAVHSCIFNIYNGRDESKLKVERSREVEQQKQLSHTHYVTEKAREKRIRITQKDWNENHNEKKKMKKKMKANRCKWILLKAHSSEDLITNQQNKCWKSLPCGAHKTYLGLYKL